LEDNGDRQQKERRGSRSVEHEDEGIYAMVEGCLGDDVHASVDKLYDDGDQVGLHRLHLHGFYWILNGSDLASCL